MSWLKHFGTFVAITNKVVKVSASRSNFELGKYYLVVYGAQTSRRPYAIDAFIDLDIFCTSITLITTCHVWFMVSLIVGVYISNGIVVD